MERSWFGGLSLRSMELELLLYYLRLQTEDGRKK